MQSHFTDTIFYQIELTAKYCKMLGMQVFEKFQTGITCEEYAVLDVLICNKELCQRDLAKMILKDRANTGKLLDALESKGYITRKLSIKNNRPVKIVEITDSGIAKFQDVLSKVQPHYEQIKEKIQNSDLTTMVDLLKEFRNILNESMEIQI